MTRAEHLRRVERDNRALPRPSVYHAHESTASQEDFLLMCTIDELHLRHPFMGSRRPKDELKKPGIIVNHKRVQRPMPHASHGPASALSEAAHEHVPSGPPAFPLRAHLTIDRPKQARAADVTFISMARGVLHLVTIID